MFTSSSSSFSPPAPLAALLSPPARPTDKPRIGIARLPNNSRPQLAENNNSCSSSGGRITTRRLLLQALTVSMGAFPFSFAASARAGILSGYTGIESVPGPDLPSIEFLNHWNDENQKLYAENDARFKDSPILKELLEKSKLNRDKNKQQVLDKYCLRGAEWGVGDCSAEGMTADERDAFIASLKAKLAQKD